MPWLLKNKTGEEYIADCELLSKIDKPKLMKHYGWSKGFNWFKYLDVNNSFTAYKLVINGDTGIQGLIALCPEEGYVLVDLIEKSPNNRKPFEEFINVAEVLFGFACKCSLDSGYRGFIMFYPKSVLAEHYITKYKAQYVGRGFLALGELEAKSLISLYYI